jgi:hypothetical protein
MATRIGKCEKWVFLIGLRGALVNSSDGQSLFIASKLQHGRNDIISNVKVDDIAINCPYQNRVAGGRAQSSGNAPLSADIAAHAA